MPGPELAADAAEIRHVVQQRVDQRAARMPGGRVHHHARRLVDDDEVCDPRTRRRAGCLRLRLGGRGFRHVDHDRRPPTLHGRVGANGAPAHLHQAFLDQPLDAAIASARAGRRPGTGPAARPSYSSATASSMRGMGQDGASRRVCAPPPVPAAAGAASQISITMLSGTSTTEMN